MRYLPRCSVGGTRCRSASTEAGKFYWGSVLHKSEWALQMSRASPQFLTKVFYFRNRGLNGRLDPTIRRLVSWQAKEDSLKNAVIRTGSTAEEQDRAPGEVIEGAIGVTVDRAAKVQRDKFVQTLRSRVVHHSKTQTAPLHPVDAPPTNNLTGFAVSRIEIFDQPFIN